jgi:hypothetical protein
MNLYIVSFISLHYSSSVNYRQSECSIFKNRFYIVKSPRFSLTSITSRRTQNSAFYRQVLWLIREAGQSMHRVNLVINHR